ncbi:O-antigen acyltransferase [Hyphomicrobium denitrificans 1NES1]|uniref:O-antigen acyltransferase n=1 Tax=Hyphomicrobium denitrificans 1NES1 TaxID=670307 RepID=N0B4Y9_9HYPH|nr:SGNH hydrolase domain-containing protein [Hyphomicrobium denitrificans]AGK57292.1 O-antigen acyltransferase [Hyphomicrobium denitrificans 1NES1]
MLVGPIVGGVPRFGYEYSPLDCMSRPFQRNGCATSELKRVRVAQHEIINRAIKASTGDKVSFIDPYDFLCDEVSCRNLDDDKRPIYSDESHLSRWGSVYLVTKMVDALASALEQGQDVAAAR